MYPAFISLGTSRVVTVPVLCGAHAAHTVSGAVHVDIQLTQFVQAKGIFLYPNGVLHLLNELL